MMMMMMMMAVMIMMTKRKKDLAFIESHIALFTLPAFLTVTPESQIGSDGLKLIEILIKLNEL